MASKRTAREAALESQRRTLERTLPFFCSWWAPLSFSVFSVAVAAVLELRLGASASFTANAIGFVLLVTVSVAYMGVLRLVAHKVGIGYAPWPHIRPAPEQPTTP